jgi:hypothetical protein
MLSAAKHLVRFTIPVMKKRIAFVLLTVLLVVVPFLPDAEHHLGGVGIDLYFLCLFTAAGLAIRIVWEAFKKA